MASGTLTDNGSTDWVLVRRGSAAIKVRGTWSSGSIQPEIRTATGEAIAIGDEMTEDSAVAFDSQTSEYVRLTLTGAGSPSLEWEINPEMTSRAYRSS
jgi:hypothetical protein